AWRELVPAPLTARFCDASRPAPPLLPLQLRHPFHALGPADGDLAPGARCGGEAQHRGDRRGATDGTRAGRVSRLSLSLRTWGRWAVGGPEEEAAAARQLLEIEVFR